jgi:flagellar M-ring protein FliF
MTELALKNLNLRELRELKEVPIVRQLALLAGIALAVAAGLLMFFWAQQPAQQTLFPGMSAEENAQLATTLRDSGIPYSIDRMSGAVTVPPERMQEARMRAAAQGLPKAAGTGFEMIEKDQGFGTSQFIEGARYQMAIETELARTVSSLQPVKAARVHLAIPKPSAFSQAREPASASVLVELYPGRQLDPNQVQSIQHLVASSVPNMAASAVSVIDQYGRLLSRDADGELAQSTEQYQYARRVEEDYIGRVQTLLAPMLGRDRVSVQVAADLDFSQVEEATERFGPQAGLLRNEQTANEVNTRSRAEGVPGALSNVAPANAADAAAAAAAAATDSTRAAPSSTQVSESKQATRNFELDRTLSHKRQAIGTVKRLSVAVLVDQPLKPDASGALVPTPLTEEELAGIEQLVRQAVGFSEARGDTLSVRSAPFVAAQVDSGDQLPIWKRPEALSYARILVGAAIVLGLIFGIGRPLMRNLFGPPPAPAAPEVPPLMAALVDANGNPQDPSAAGALTELAADQLSLSTDLAAAGAAGNALASPGPSLYEQKLAAARASVSDDPKRVAQVIKSWLNDDA